MIVSRWWLVASLGLGLLGPGLAHAQEAHGSPPPGATSESIPIWRNGHPDGEVARADAARAGLLVLDLGDGWVPDLFDDGAGPDGSSRAHAFRATYLALAREDFPDDDAGHRAERDRYLESYGIVPTLSVLRARASEVSARACNASVDYATLRTLGGDDRPPDEIALLDTTGLAEQLVQSLLLRSDGWDPSSIADLALGRDERVRLDIHARWARWRNDLRAVQQRLACDGHLRVRFTRGALDEPTRNALAELERRHRIYAPGILAGPTLEALRTEPLELERRAVLRGLTERAMLAAGMIEDAGVVVTPDGWPRTYYDASGRPVAMRDLEGEMSARIVASFGLQSVASTRAWLDTLGELPRGSRLRVAIPAIDPPPYYAPDMDLHVVIDRGDVWYDFPFDAEGHALAQPLVHRPTLSLYARYFGQEILLARYPTTIGGWRIEGSADGDRWRYYGSPVGPAAWQRVVSAPVWLPPASTPASDLVTEYTPGASGQLVREVKRTLLGPGYASAYGLVAAYHRPVTRRSDGTLALGADQGVRTHGSVDYASIWRASSHGCHRLHNHLAVRLFTFVLAHRPHRRLGHERASFSRHVDLGDVHEDLRVDRGGYAFDLDRPVMIEVLPGWIQGTVREPPIETFPVVAAPPPGAVHRDRSSRRTPP